MTSQDIGTKLVELCKQGKNAEAMTTLYSPDIVSVEAAAPPGKSSESKSIDACAEKGKQFAARHEVHGVTVEGPFPHGDRFAVYFDYEVTTKENNQRLHINEVALYTVKNDKIVREEFFYAL